MELNEITKKIIGCAYRVSNEPGSGFLPKVEIKRVAYRLAETQR